MKNIIPTMLIGFAAGVLGAIFVLQTSPPGANVPSNSQNENLTTSADKISNHEQNIVAAVQKASPAVVSIIITQDVPVFERSFEQLPNLFGNPFGGSFFNFGAPRLEQRGTERREVGGGSGFIVSSDGFIVTNRHVVSETDAEYTVFTNDGERYDAEIVARDPVNDIAILKVTGSGLPSLQFADSDDLQVGQTTIAIGNALSEFDNSVSTGVISGLSRSIVAGDSTGSSEAIDEVIQTDAAINPGNSGGPLLDLAGNVIGVNVAVALGSENIGFALPANLVSSVIETVKETGKISRPYIGVRYVAITPALQDQNDLPTRSGVLVIGGGTPDELAVVPGSPADKAGIREGDIITSIDGTELNEDTSLASSIRTKTVGDTITLELIRQDVTQTVTLTLEEIPTQ